MTDHEFELIKEKARELIERSKNPPPGLEAYPSEAKSLESSLLNDSEDIYFEIVDMGRYDGGGLLGFAKWLLVAAPMMVKDNTVLVEMMVEDGIPESDILEICRRAGNEIDDVSKYLQESIQTVSLSELTEEPKTKTKISFRRVGICFVLILLGLSYFYFFDIDMRGEIESTEEEFSDLEGNYAVYVSSDDFDCESDVVYLQIKGLNGWTNVSSKNSDDDYRDYDQATFEQQCFPMFDKNGWTFVGILGHDTDDKTFRVMYEDDKSRDHAIVSSPVIGMNPEQPPLFTIFLIAAALLGVTFFVSWKSVAIDKEETKTS
ncbi:MAG: hypothetical protein DWC02_00895 [Candidatus Poseidoniales archaeon]|nr:MAG: hypothetical protein DWC02_00895 [Candidatus Poseidoniales archaeon]